MRTNFWNPLYINDQGTQIEVGGPFDWEGGTGQVTIEWTVTQGGVHAGGRTGSYNQGDMDWEDNGNAEGGTFQPGQATATGTIRGTSTPPPAPWPPQPVQLVHDSTRGVAIDGDLRRLGVADDDAAA
jgi:hypothetical protein